MSRLFNAAAIAEAKDFAQQSHTWDRPQVTGFTIDGSTSLDLDDAIWIEETDTGATLSVHIADVAEAIAPGSELDQAAIAHCHTRYFKEGNAPMLPRIISEAALSLQEELARPTLTIQLQITSSGKVVDIKLFESFLISSKRFSYAQADYAITDTEHQWHETLVLCQRWTAVLNRKRRASGAIGGMFSKRGVYFNENGQLSENPNASYHSHRIIEEFMIAANTAAAQWLADGDHPALFRNHTAKDIAPDQDRMLKALLLLGNANAIRQRLQQWLNRAEYGPVLIGHFALNLDAYGHFTSPIRRLADLINHRIIKARLRGLDAPYSKNDLSNLGRHINQKVWDDDRKNRKQYKVQAERDLQNQLDTPEQFQYLTEKEFSRLIKHAIDDIPAALLQEVQERLGQGLLTTQDYYVLVVEGNNRALQRQVLQTIEQQPQEAASIIAMAKSIQQWSATQYIEQKQESRFLAWVIIEIDDEAKTTIEPGIATKKQVAKHRACWYWLTQWVEQALVEPEQRVVPEPPKVEPQIEIKTIPVASRGRALPSQFLDGQNHVGTLTAHCQTMGWQPPTFDYTEISHGFQCTCLLISPDQSIEGTGSATKKKLAKQRAAMRVLEALEMDQ